MSDESQALRLELFEKTGLKVDENDPIIQLYLIQNSIMKSSVQQFQDGLNSLGDAILTDITEQQEKVLSGFDEKRDELLEILTKLEKQKEAIVADVWQKLDKRISDKIHKQLSEDMQAIANNANNKINNQRNMFIGGIVGLLIGIVFSVILFVFK